MFEEPSAEESGSRDKGAPLNTAAIAAWLVDGARSASKSEDVLTEMCVRLSRCGVPLRRVAVYVNTLHPQILARRFLWRPGADAGVDEAPFAFATNVGYRDSPINRIRATGETIRRRLADPDCPLDFEVLKELRVELATDYLATPL